MKKYLALALCCVIASISFVNANHEVAENALKAAIVKLIIKSRHFEDSTTAKAKQHKLDDRSLKQLFTILRDQKKNPAVLEALAQNEKLQKAVSIVESIIGDNETQRKSLEKQMDKFDDGIVESFMCGLVQMKNFSAEEIQALEAVIETAQESAPAQA